MKKFLVCMDKKNCRGNAFKANRERAMCEKVKVETDAQLEWAADQTGKNKEEIIAYCLNRYLKNLQTPFGDQQDYREQTVQHNGSHTPQ